MLQRTLSLPPNKWNVRRTLCKYVAYEHVANDSTEVQVFIEKGKWRPTPCFNQLLYPSFYKLLFFHAHKESAVKGTQA